MMVDPANTFRAADGMGMAAAVEVRSERVLARASVPSVVRQRFDRLESATGLRSDRRHAAETRASRSHAQVGVARIGRGAGRGVVAVLLEVRGQKDGAVDGDRETAVPASDHDGADNQL